MNFLVGFVHLCIMTFIVSRDHWRITNWILDKLCERESAE